MNNQGNKLDSTARFFVYSAVASLAFSPVLVNTALLGLLICALCSRTFWSAGHDLVRNPFVQLSLLAFGLLVAGVLWSEAEAVDAWSWIFKYKKLLFVPLVMPFFQEKKSRKMLIWVLFWSLFINVVFIVLINLKINLEYNSQLINSIYIKFQAGGASRITLSVLHVFLFVICINLVNKLQNSRVKFLIYCVAALVVYEVFFVLSGRTGQFILVIVMLILLLRKLRERKRSIGSAMKISAVAFMVFAIILGSVLNDKESRLRVTLEKVINHKTEALRPESDSVSVDVRLIFYRSAIEIISLKPLLGWGTGGHEIGFAEVASRGKSVEERIAFKNPHNEYLMWASQLGILGLMTFVAWLMFAWKLSEKNESDTEKQVLRGWWIIFCIGCCINSFLLDFSEGYMTVLIAGCLLPLNSKIGDSKKIN